ncbi:MAG: tRNA pseudouridine(13) synthase TruD [Lysobacterales bacterium]
MMLAYAHGGPALRGVLKQQPEDFIVEETLGFAADGQGEHDLLQIEKRDANTEWVARTLARHAKVPLLAVGYAGLKDRHGVTRQYFTVQLPGRQVDWSTYAAPGVRVLEVARHSRKLKRGGLTGNRFVLVLRHLVGDPTLAEARLRVLAAAGAPNYFGTQRFGREGGNLALARQLHAGATLGRSERSFALSAARSALFNAMLHRRVLDGSWNQPIDGDLMNLAGKRAWFGPIAVDPVLQQRCAEHDIHPTGALWGGGELPSAGACAALEQAVAASETVYAELLVSTGLEQERRALRVCADALHWRWLAADTLELAFALPAGAYATSFVRELIDWAEPEGVLDE